MSQLRPRTVATLSCRKQCSALSPSSSAGELLGKLMEGKRGIAIAGSHGKTTTTALIGWILTQAGLDPTVVVGGEVPELGGNVRRGAGDFFVAEADEYDAAFLSLHPEVAVITNIEAEHLDFLRILPA